jgi:hypothetical protein
VRGEELGDGGNVLRGHRALAGHDLILFLGNIELVEPTEDFDLGAISVRDLGPEAVDDRMLGQEVVGQEQLRVVVEFFEEDGQDGVVEPASRENKVPVDLALRVGGRQRTIEQAVESIRISVRHQIGR